MALDRGNAQSRRIADRPSLALVSSRTALPNGSCCWARNNRRLPTCAEHLRTDQRAQRIREVMTTSHADASNTTSRYSSEGHFIAFA
jgi:cell division FtsZ-interacting protein ZapD